MKRFQKFAGVCALTTTLLASAVPTFAKDGDEFGEAYGNELLQQKLMSNYDVEQGAEYISRAQFVGLVNDTFRIKHRVYNPFSDVDKKHKYYEDILAAARTGYINGDEGKKFYPNREITRVEVAAMISNLIERDENLLGRVYIGDMDVIPDWANYSVNTVVANNIMQLDEQGKFNPNELVTYDEAYAVLSQVIDGGYIQPRIDEVLTIEAEDGYELTGRLSYPADLEKVEKLVINVNGSGAMNYLAATGAPGYDEYYIEGYDIFAEEFVNNDVAFFSYNTRGVENVRKKYPYQTVNEEGYITYTAQNNAKDIKAYVDELRKNPKLKDAEIYLLGWSEGTITAPHAIVDEGADVDGLILVGYANYNLKDYVVYQTNGERDFGLLMKLTGNEGVEYFTEEDYTELSEEVKYAFFGGASFEDIDVNEDDKITDEDFIIIKQEYHNTLMTAFDEGDEKFIRENYFDAPIEWYESHFAYGDNIDTMLDVDVPIYILHGTYDASIPYQDSLDAREMFDDYGKDNLTVEIVEGADHNVDLSYWINTTIMPEGVERIFDIVENEF